MSDFIVRRTMGYGGQPCPEAFKSTRQLWDRRTVATPQEFDDRGLGRGPNGTKRWFDEGTEHGTWGDGSGSNSGGIKRRMKDEECWRVSISTIDDLLAFITRNGRVVIEPGYSSDELEIELYDGYRE